MKLHLLALACAAAIFAPVCHASALYTLTDGSSAWTVTLDSFVPANSDVTGTCKSAGQSDTTCILYSTEFGDNYDEFDFYRNLFGSGYYAVFAPGAFTTPGVYSSQSHNDYNPNLTLIVAEVGATPEPSSIALLGTGVLGVAGTMRRRILKK